MQDARAYRNGLRSDPMLVGNSVVKDRMRAIEIAGAGGPEVLRMVERPIPVVNAGEVLIAIAAAGLNHGDLLQRRGLYPPPPGVSDIPGLEASGIIAAVGPGVTGWQVGDRVCALLAGGGYASFAVAPAVQCLPIPDGFDMIEAGAIPEALFTCWMTLVRDGGIKQGDTVLIHGGSSGIGTTGIAMAKALGADVYTTAGTAEKVRACLALGADLAINYREEDFVARVAAEGRPVDIVLDMVGGDYLARNIATMAPGGRHISIALMGGFEGQLPMATMMLRRLRIMGSTLRGLPVAEKGELARALHAKLWPLIAEGRLRPVIDRTFPLADAADAHRALEAGGHIGKIVLTL